MAGKVPEQFREMYAKAMDGKHRTMAIRAYCLQCCVWRAGEVRQCISVSCPLFPYRLTGKPKPSQDADANEYLHPERVHDQYVSAVTGKSRRLAIRTACRSCSAWDDGEVRNCDRKTCALHPYRLRGTNAPTEKQVEAGRRIGKERRKPQGQ